MLVHARARPRRAAGRRASAIRPTCSIGLAVPVRVLRLTAEFTTTTLADCSLYAYCYNDLNELAIYGIYFTIYRNHTAIKT